MNFSDSELIEIGRRVAARATRSRISLVAPNASRVGTVAPDPTRKSKIARSRPAPDLPPFVSLPTLERTASDWNGVLWAGFTRLAGPLMAVPPTEVFPSLVKLRQGLVEGLNSSVSVWRTQHPNRLLPDPDRLKAELRWANAQLPTVLNPAADPEDLVAMLRDLGSCKPVFVAAGSYSSDGPDSSAALVPKVQLQPSHLFYFQQPIAVPAAEVDQQDPAWRRLTHAGHVASMDVLRRATRGPKQTHDIVGAVAEISGVLVTGHGSELGSYTTVLLSPIPRLVPLGTLGGERLGQATAVFPIRIATEGTALQRVNQSLLAGLLDNHPERDRNYADVTKTATLRSGPSVGQGIA